MTQLDELIQHCIWTWTILNSVEGMLVVGPNGNYHFSACCGLSLRQQSLRCRQLGLLQEFVAPSGLPEQRVRPELQFG